MTEPAVPGVEEIARAIDPDAWDRSLTYLDRAGAQEIATQKARAILDLFAPILAEKEREIQALERERLHQIEVAQSHILAAEAALAGERERAQQVLEPFDDALGEDDEGYGDGLTVVMKWGACTDYSVTLGDLRDVRKLAAAIRAQGG